MNSISGWKRNPMIWRFADLKPVSICAWTLFSLLPISSRLRIILCRLPTEADDDDRHLSSLSTSSRGYRASHKPTPDIFKNNYFQSEIYFVFYHLFLVRLDGFRWHSLLRALCLLLLCWWFFFLRIIWASLHIHVLSCCTNNGPGVKRRLDVLCVIARQNKATKKQRSWARAIYSQHDTMRFSS